VSSAALRPMQCTTASVQPASEVAPGRAPAAAARAQVFLFRAVDLGLRLSAAFQSASGAAHGIRPDLRMRQSGMYMQCGASAAA